MKTLHEIAEENNLEIVDVTTGSNGYPSNTYYAIDATGFESFDKVAEFADDNNLDISLLHRKDGWHFYESKGRTWKPIQVSSEDYGDNYTEFSKMDEEDFINEEVKPLIEDATEFEQIQAILETKREIWEQIDLMDENEIVITHEGRYYETVSKVCLSFSEDTHNWIIALTEK